MRLLRFVLLLVLLSALLLACGGDDDDGDNGANGTDAPTATPQIDPLPTADVDTSALDATYSSEDDVLSVNYPGDWQADVDPEFTQTSLRLTSPDGYELIVFLFTESTAFFMGMDSNASLEDNIQAVDLDYYADVDFTAGIPQRLGAFNYVEKVGAGQYDERDGIFALGIAFVEDGYVLFIESRWQADDATQDTFDAHHAVGRAIISTMRVNTEPLPQLPRFDPNAGGNTDIASVGQFESPTTTSSEDGRINLVHPSNDFEVTVYANGFEASDFYDPDEPGGYDLMVSQDGMEAFHITPDNVTTVMESIAGLAADSAGDGLASFAFLSGILEMEMAGATYVEIVFTTGGQVVAFGVLTLEDNSQYVVNASFERGGDDLFFEYHAVGRALIQQFAEQVSP